jgi:hypothetical protein
MGEPQGKKVFVIKNEMYFGNLNNMKTNGTID